MSKGFNFASYVLAAGRDRPDHPALIVPGGDVCWSHGDLLARVERRAGALRRLDLPAGARVILRLADTPDFPITYLACAAAGLVPVATSAQLTRAEITPMVAQLDPALAVVDPSVAPPDGVRQVEPGDLNGEPLAYDDWMLGDAERLGYIVFTSGSGGRPRAVAHAHRAVRARQMMWKDWYDLRTDDRVMHAGAFNWTYTLGTGLLDPWSRGATALIPPHGTDAAALPALIAGAHATIFAAAPGVYRRILRAPMPAMPALRHGLSAGESLPTAIRNDWRAKTGTDLHEALGMSECSTFISGSPDRPAPDGFAGYPQTGRRIRVLDGALQISTSDPGLMLGYWEGDGPSPVAGDWFDTGDSVEQAADGAIRYLGRRDDILNPGGYRVSPLEIEAACQGLPVEDIAVGQVTLPSGATVLAAYYVGAPLDEAAATAHLATRLARYKQPRLWLRRDRLPRNANGKLIRSKLAETAEAGQPPDAS
ncbi:class I adenylate-forming enzyme family protein [Jannaschia aquimarina]|uniref:Hcl protein n=1 Tax=Jannaschia aquimarina TaxID=935700 RepID=A0A0D1CMC8_9RHOB|nr:class I adenylate-forming enzyme family protein [Jannaschia aquimarina]KIT15922.1 3-hydroxybenzoate--CoA/4-hydroxybenzoate--CoA ligase [Jannaschia aquimarina]SNS97878.1 Acyl-CoA synthetase (AMP-forming)/AMP-acid ligase II [Jannaschia aquimarina]